MENERKKKDRTHARILDSARMALRKRGIAGLSVGQAMKGAGLTVGGFYAHFPSKDALLRETLERNLEAGRAWLLKGAEGLGLEERLRFVVERYLSLAHRDSRDAGCLIPVVLSELERSGTAAQKIMADVFESLVEETTLADPSASNRRTVMAVIAACVGGLALSRALGESPLSDEVLEATRTLLLGYLGQPVGMQAHGS